MFALPSPPPTQRRIGGIIRGKGEKGGSDNVTLYKGMINGIYDLCGLSSLTSTGTNVESCEREKREIMLVSLS